MLLYQPKNGYSYNSDSMLLYDFVSSFSPKGSLIDIGCGVGVISILLSRDFKLATTIIDKQEIMLSYATRNYAINQIPVIGHLGDIDAFRPKKQFDIVVSNPPFYDSNVVQSSNEHLNIARYTHHMPIKSLVTSAKRLLAPRGYFMFCYDAKQIDALLWQLKESKLNTECIQFVHSKINKESKLVLIACRAGSKSMTKILPPLIVQDQQNNYLPNIQAIFDRADTYSIKG